MAKIWEPQDKLVYDNWIDIIIGESELNEWEERFIHDIQFKMRCGKTLSQGQAEKLEQIYVQKTSLGSKFGT